MTAKTTKTDTKPKTPGMVAVLGSDAETCGAIVYWHLSGGIDIETLKEAWEMSGLDPSWLPEAPGPTVVLRRAVQTAAGKNKLVRPHPVSGFVLVDEKLKDSELDWEQSLHVRIQADGELAFEASDLKTANLIEAAYKAANGQLGQPDVSPWLTKLVDRMDAIALRDTGGIYFVPKHMVPQWESVVQALRASHNHQIFAIPAMKSDEAVTAILESLAADIETSVAAIREHTEADTTKERGARTKTVQNRIATSEALVRKVAAYEKLMGTKLDRLHEKLTDLKAELTTALIKAEEPKAPKTRYVEVIDL